MRLAVQLYSVRDELKKDLWGTLRKVRGMGYEGVEFFGDFTHTAYEVAAALDDTELTCVGWHTPMHYLQPPMLMAAVTYNKVLGNTNIVIPSLPEEMRGSKAAWLKTAETLEALAEKLAGYGMGLGYHNHSDEFIEMEGGLPFHYLFDNTSRLAMQFDNGNAWASGPETDIYDPLTRYAGRARTLHHKPFSLKSGYATMFGRDDIDWQRYLDLTAENQDLEWHIIEYECDKEYGQMEGIELSFKAFKNFTF